MIEVHLECAAGLATTDGCGAWVFDLDHWGRAGLGPDEAAALADLAGQLAVPVTELAVVQRIQGDELTFARDHRPATRAEVAATAAILAQVRPQTLALIAGASEAELDWRDPRRVLPEWATWHTLRQMGWHVANVESRYYLAALGVAAPPPAADLIAELRASHAHVLAALPALPAAATGTTGSGSWSTVKVLRRLAWHERSELRVMRELAHRAARAAGAARAGGSP